MKASLEATVELWDFAVFAEIAVWETRPDLQHLCAAARDQGALDEDAIDSMVPGLSPRARKNLLRHLGYIQLIDRSGALTAVGRRCASVGEAPSWEQGAYHLLVAAHPLFGSHVLDFKRTPGDGFDRDFDNLETIPGWLSADSRRVFTSAFDGAVRFSVGGFPSARGQDAVCRGWEMDPGRLRWEIDLATGVNHWTVEGNVGSGEQPRQFRSAPESVDASELVGLFGGWESRWDARLGRVAIGYDGKVDAGGRESFLRTWKYQRVRVGRFGTFDDALVQDVPVGPATNDDARTWATAIVVARAEAAGAYVPPDRWRTEWSAVLENTPLAGRAGDAPDAASLGEVNQNPVPARTRWLLAAGVDLGMGA